uniref:sigma factor n=1 Tax=Enterocloster clostridioformis TaxID=1531 RepID=UPI0026EE443D|nr:sigma factor [Enterocloster clostridioformis]
MPLRADRLRRGGRGWEYGAAQVRRFIHAVAWKYRDSGELEDLEQEGYLALYPAIDGYDPAQGVKFAKAF